MTQPIITYPNKKLFLKSEPVKDFNQQLHILLDNMYETMIAGSGVGLAAIQIDIPLRIFLANPPDEEGNQSKDDLFEIINPKLELVDDEKVIFTEGCLSIPGFFEEVQRYKNVALTYQDRFGNKKTLEASDFLAVIIQHENDHLDGHLFIEKLSYQKRKKFEKEFKEAQKALKNKK